MSRVLLRLAAGTFVSVLLTGCVMSNVLAATGFDGLSANTAMLLMPPDIKYYRVTASCINQPIAEWTSTARDEFDSAITGIHSRS